MKIDYDASAVLGASVGSQGQSWSGTKISS